MVLTLKTKKQTIQNFQTLTDVMEHFSSSFKRKGKSKKIQVDYDNGIKRFNQTLFDFNHHISMFDG